MMFRFNNPDAMLALLLTGAIYATMRGLERAQTKWLVLAGALVGFGFITKMMQAFLILPVLAVVYLLAAPTGWWRRVWQVVLMGVSVLVAAGWWVAAVALTPAADRPYVGGSQNNSILNLIFGYNGFGRLSGNEAGSVGGGRVAGSMWGPTGLTRLFNTEFGNMMSWLLPGALVMGAVLLVVTIRARRTDRERAALLLWGGSLVCTGLVISLAQGIIHPYYTVALAAPLGGLVGIATMGLWQRRGTWVGRIGSGRRPGRDGDLELRAPRPHLGLVPGPAPLRGGGGCARRRRHPLPPAAAISPQAGRRPRGRARLRRRAGRTALLDGRHGGHPAQRGDPVGDPDPGRGGGPGGGFPGGGFPGGGFRRAFGGGLPRRWLPGGGFPGGGFPGGGFPGGAGSRHRRPARGGFPGRRTLARRWRVPPCLRRRARRLRRAGWWRVPELEPVQSRP